jgi:hypothetical protein
MSIAFFKSKINRVESNKRNWNNQEIADFYRAVDILRQAGLSTEVDSGVTDEGDPWFVFIRPDNGDVIAHFAQIDGAFIAVSSLNQEIYKGHDIRCIVDQMLDRHPMLLPQNKNSGRLLLHPTAALSAFLAAAFILTIDGVKASSLQDVMVKVASENITLINAEVSVTENVLRSDTSKPMFSDLNSSNYNVAILGVALIVHELIQNEFMASRFPEIDEDKIGAINKENEETVGVDGSIVISSENIRNYENENYASYSFKSTDLKSDEQENDRGVAKDDVSDGKATIIDGHDVTFSDGSVEVVTAFSANHKVLWTNVDAFAKDNYQTSNKIAKVNVGDEAEAVGQLETVGQLEVTGLLETANQHSSEVEDIGSSSKLGVFAENVQGAFEKIPSVVDLETIMVPDSLVITFESTGELRLVSLQSLDFKAPISMVKTDVFEPYQGSETLLVDDQKNDFGIDSDGLSVENDAIADLDSNTNELIYSKPILGHSLEESDQVLHLSDAIDVVFYQGGNSEISGFELGTDLLWFFLSAEELALAENSVNQSGDLILDFHDLGTLTFLGIVTDTASPDYIV